MHLKDTVLCAINNHQSINQSITGSPILSISFMGDSSRSGHHRNKESRMVVARECGLAEMGNCYLMSIEFPFCKKSSGDGWWRRLHNDMNVLSAELCAYVGGR